MYGVILTVVCGGRGKRGGGGGGGMKGEERRVRTRERDSVASMGSTSVEYTSCCDICCIME